MANNNGLVAVKEKEIKRIEDEGEPSKVVLPKNPKLRFTPTAWAKLHYMRDKGSTEVAGFGITTKEDPMLVEDFVTIKQSCTSASVELDDPALSDFMLDMADKGLQPVNYMRIWIHTHPGNGANPSSGGTKSDYEMFCRVFGPSDWAVMFILAKGGNTYCNLRFNVGPGGDMVIPHEVDMFVPFKATDYEAWEKEYNDNVCKEVTVTRSYGDICVDRGASCFDPDDYNIWRGDNYGPYVGDYRGMHCMDKEAPGSDHDNSIIITSPGGGFQRIPVVHTHDDEGLDDPFGDMGDQEFLSKIERIRTACKQSRDKFLRALEFDNWRSLYPRKKHVETHEEPPNVLQLEDEDLGDLDYLGFSQGVDKPKCDGKSCGFLSEANKDEDLND